MLSCCSKNRAKKEQKKKKNTKRIVRDNHVKLCGSKRYCKQPTANVQQSQRLEIHRLRHKTNAYSSQVIYIGVCLCMHVKISQFQRLVVSQRDTTCSSLHFDFLFCPLARFRCRYPSFIRIISLMRHNIMRKCKRQNKKTTKFQLVSITFTLIPRNYCRCMRPLAVSA